MTITVSCSSPFRTASTAAMLREVLHPDGALGPEQTHGPGFVGKASGIGRDVVAVDPDELERVGGVVDRALGHGQARSLIRPISGP